MLRLRLRQAGRRWRGGRCRPRVRQRGAARGGRPGRCACLAGLLRGEARNCRRPRLEVVAARGALSHCVCARARARGCEAAKIAMRELCGRVRSCYVRATALTLKPTPPPPQRHLPPNGGVSPAGTHIAVSVLLAALGKSRHATQSLRAHVTPNLTLTLTLTLARQAKHVATHDYSPAWLLPNPNPNPNPRGAPPPPPQCNHVGCMLVPWRREGAGCRLRDGRRSVGTES